MQDLAQSRLNILSFLTESTHILGIALGTPFCSKGAVVGKVNLDVCVLRFYARFLLAETCQPCVAIGVGEMESGEEGWGAFAFEVDSADLGCRCMEIVGQAGALE
jgi:hypothetical protein